MRNVTVSFVIEVDDFNIDEEVNNLINQLSVVSTDVFWEDVTWNE